MPIAAGTRLGPYEVVAPIGAGGMGEVWRGRDTRLDRSVAIKILPASFAENAQFKLRFEREAKAISQLNHPHICTLYDVGDSYIVMELLDGESLADKLAKGPLPLEQVLRYGTQIADALDKAHRQGIVHRDLKPGNIMLTKGGAKLLDFGLAKSTTGVIDGDGATQHKPLTQEGTILGTFQYMAPEQLEGTQADARTDIFALGTVLYEMATGRRAFEGKTKTSLIAAIVSSEPAPMSQIQPLMPAALEHVVRKCLAKDPKIAGNRHTTSPKSCDGSAKRDRRPVSPRRSPCGASRASGCCGQLR
ncbi:MAG TPA: serine/threonine-protein kinase [Thermoanaerobaculia bacterium]